MTKWRISPDNGTWTKTENAYSGTKNYSILKLKQMTNSATRGTLCKISKLDCRWVDMSNVKTVWETPKVGDVNEACHRRVIVVFEWGAWEAI